MGLLEYPQYTRPQEFDGHKVPDILLSGHHANIKKWQRYEALKKTYLVRPELLNEIELSKEDLKMLEEIKKEVLK
jgi:tRNA (guanine37-N1)-methyltransferase